MQNQCPTILSMYQGEQNESLITKIKILNQRDLCSFIHISSASVTLTVRSKRRVSQKFVL